MAQVFDMNKLRELILYIAQSAESDPRLGAVKLNKLLFYADTRAYLELGKSITGATYQHLAEGPAPIELLEVRRRMVADEDAHMASTWYLTRIQSRLVPNRPADLSAFSADELRVVHDVIHDLWDLDATAVSDLSHQEWGYRLTEPGDWIPMRAAWFSPEPLDEIQIKQGQKLWETISRESASL